MTKVNHKVIVAVSSFVVFILGARSAELVFDVTGTESYATKIGASCEKIVKNGTGTLTLTATEDADFTGAVEVNAGILKINRIGNLGNPSSIVIASGATLDLSGTETAKGRQPWCPSLTIGGSGCTGATGALVRNSGAAWDRMFKNVTLTDDTVVDFGVETSFGYGSDGYDSCLSLNGHNLTKRGSGSFQLQKRGRVTGDGNIIVEGQTVFENVDMSAGDPAKNSVIVRSQLRWWSSRYDKPINWKLRCEAGGYVNVQDPNVAAFNSYRLWAGPVESTSGIALTNSVSYSDAAMTYSGNIALGGALALTSKGSVRLAGSSVSADSLDMRNGGLQLSPPSGSAMTFAKASQAYGFFDGICNGSTVMFGGTFSARNLNSFTRLRGGDYTFGGEVTLGSNGRTNIWDVSGGSSAIVSNTVTLGYTITTAAGHDGTFSIRGAGTVFTIQNGKSLKASRTANTKEIVNISDGAVFVSPRLTVTTSNNVPSAEFYVNVDGGTVKPTYGYGWTGGSAANSGYEPTAFTIFEGGLTIDLGECWADNVPGGKDGARMPSSFSMALVRPGEGRRIASISLPAGEPINTNRYASVPPVTITGVTGASAFLDIDPTTRQPNGIVVTSKGWSLSDGATAKVESPDGKTVYTCPITSEEQPSDGWKGLTVLGASGTALQLKEVNTYRGPTVAKSSADVRFMVQDGRPLDSGLIVEKGSTIRFNNTDQSARAIPFIQGGGTIQGFSSTITANAIYVTTAELMAGDFIHVNGGLVLPANTVIKVVDPENLNAETFGRERQILSATTLTLPESGLSEFVVDAGRIIGNPWRIKMYGANGLALRPPSKALCISFR